MSRLSFTVFSIEMYSEYLGLPSPEVFGIFRDSGLLEMLARDYKYLHGLSLEYLMDEFDYYLRGREYE